MFGKLFGKKREDAAQGECAAGTAEQIIDEIRRETQTPCYELEVTDQAAGLCESKLGGVPYLPKGEALPVNGKGEQLRLLAQINCADIAELEGFPHEGLLQFFIGTDSLMGANFDDLLDTDGFAVKFLPACDGSVTEAEVRARLAPLKEGGRFPLQSENRRLAFRLKSQAISASDYRFDGVLAAKKEKFGIEGDEDDGQIARAFCDKASKIGGYAFFTQDDPRCVRRELAAYDTLLLQLVSDGQNIAWGDCGVGNFFIKKDDLLQRDFSKALYSWDCY